MPKVEFGVALVAPPLASLDMFVEGAKELRRTRSEAVEAILMAFFRSQLDHQRKVALSAPLQSPMLIQRAPPTLS